MMLVIILGFLILMAFVGVVGFVYYRGVLLRAKTIERALKMVPLLVELPPQGATGEAPDFKRQVSQAEGMFSLLGGLSSGGGLGSRFYGQRQVAFEVVSVEGRVYFYVAAPVSLVSAVEKAVTSQYPGATVAEVFDHNLFSRQGRVFGVAGGELRLKSDAIYPIASFNELDFDPLSGILNSLSKLAPGEGAGLQILIRPAASEFVARANNRVRQLFSGKKGAEFSAMGVAKAMVKAPKTGDPAAVPMVNEFDRGKAQAIQEKVAKPLFEVLIRLVASADDGQRAKSLAADMASAFAQFERPGLNGWKLDSGKPPEELATDFILRSFPVAESDNVLNSAELATMMHFPASGGESAARVERTGHHVVPAPSNLPGEGLILGSNNYRGQDVVVRLDQTDRRRHAYIVGQTGTGKSTLMENMIVQDMAAGSGLAFIDPHGDTAERLLAKVPPGRSEDVVYFDPAETERPLGLNLLEFNRPEQKDFLIQETINLLYKLYDPGRTGIIGPRYEHWYRNAALTIMADPNGATFIEIPKVFTDQEYLKQKFRYVTDPTVQEFWTKEMAQTSDFHRSEMLGWFVSKFGAFASNEVMRNIIGQTKSSIDLREVMDSGKILIVNLSKGRLGEENSKLLGMIFVIKLQMAAMSRADTPEDARRDFTLYVDEFQNFSTDSFASILSEARKYRMSLVVANQFIGQLQPAIRDAVFGNVGTITAFRTGPEDAEYLVRQFSPTFDIQDLVNLPNYNAAMRLMVRGLPSQPFSLASLPPLGTDNAELAAGLRQLSAAKYGRPRAEVEADINGRLVSQTPAKPMETVAAAA